MRFNRSVDAIEEHNPAMYHMNTDYAFNDPWCVIDTVTIDSQRRFTITKKMREIFAMDPSPGDVLAFFRNTRTNSVIIKLQRNNEVLGVWEVKSAR